MLVVHLTTESKLERARTAIRNFVADHLKTRDEKDAALVAFVSPTEKQWRFSYVKMEYATVETEAGKVGVETRLTPARRFSYIVGEGEAATPRKRAFSPCFKTRSTDPTLRRSKRPSASRLSPRNSSPIRRAVRGDSRRRWTGSSARTRPSATSSTAKDVNTVTSPRSSWGRSSSSTSCRRRLARRGQRAGLGHWPARFPAPACDGDYGKLRELLQRRP